MHDPTQPTSLIGWMQAIFGGGVTTLIVAGLARLIWHGQEARAGRRPWIGWHLAWEAPTAVAMAVVAEAGASWGGLPPTVTTGVVAVVSYLGPRGLFELIERRWGASPKP